MCGSETEREPKSLRVVECGEGVSNFLNFSFEMVCFDASSAAFLSRDACRIQRLYYNTMFVGQADTQKIMSSTNVSLCKTGARFSKNLRKKS